VSEENKAMVRRMVEAINVDEVSAAGLGRTVPQKSWLG
jgi:hypothetical protein